MRRFPLYLIVVSWSFSACSKIPPSGEEFISCTIAQRIDSTVIWQKGANIDTWTCAFIESCLSEELTVVHAIQIALLNNPHIQALFEELGIARADLLEATLLSNPSFSLDVRYPHTKSLYTNIEYVIASSLLDVLLIPLRTALAAHAFEQVKLTIAHEILDLAFRTKETYYELIAQKKKTEYLQSDAELTSILNEISLQQLAVGNISTLSSQLSTSRNLEAEIHLEQALLEEIHLEESLHKLLGLREQFCLLLPNNLPEEMIQECNVSTLEAIALEERLDLQTARFEIMRLESVLGLKRGWTYTELNGGLAGERESGGDHLLGPYFSMKIPIFNYGQAERMRTFAQLRQALNRLEELEIQLLSQVREAHKTLIQSLNIIERYKNQLLPMQDQMITSSEALYNAMGMGVDKLLEMKREELLTNQNYTESLKRYLLAKIALERAVGSSLE